MVKFKAIVLYEGIWKQKFYSKELLKKYYPDLKGKPIIYKDHEGISVGKIEDTEFVNGKIIAHFDIVNEDVIKKIRQGDIKSVSVSMGVKFKCGNEEKIPNVTRIDFKDLSLLEESKPEVDGAKIITKQSECGGSTKMSEEDKSKEVEDQKEEKLEEAVEDKPEEDVEEEPKEEELNKEKVLELIGKIEASEDLEEIKGYAKEIKALMDKVKESDEEAEEDEPKEEEDVEECSEDEKPAEEEKTEEEEEDKPAEEEKKEDSSMSLPVMEKAIEKLKESNKKITTLSKENVKLKEDLKKANATITKYEDDEKTKEEGIKQETMTKVVTSYCEVMGIKGDDIKKIETEFSTFSEEALDTIGNAAEKRLNDIMDKTPEVEAQHSNEIENEETEAEEPKEMTKEDKISDLYNKMVAASN